ncbi:hypothetical protein EJ05DRAFT_503507 [Pseudovirgaria hyperparasitica]|uniref:Uncharacterized protein n=1 Tax=Pseudovirgaria hyperparasitica TaxID=470096 RepID=A0A6A6W2E9_9PEZI|nr:uncharacterized protein EJ05DRAFT_503507 [Pseudovirgaria hyperparasitica]KAF2755201.1 hypothetical protein EJ05DRAFT_503507 [Pseudovirgaria hyperparasitica]
MRDSVPAPGQDNNWPPGFRQFTRMQQQFRGRSGPVVKVELWTHWNAEHRLTRFGRAQNRTHAHTSHFPIPYSKWIINLLLVVPRAAEDVTTVEIPPIKLATVRPRETQRVIIADSKVTFRGNARVLNRNGPAIVAVKLVISYANVPAVKVLHHHPEAAAAAAVKSAISVALLAISREIALREVPTAVVMVVATEVVPVVMEAASSARPRATRVAAMGTCRGIAPKAKNATTMHKYRKTRILEVITCSTIQVSEMYYFVYPDPWSFEIPRALPKLASASASACKLQQ